MARYPTSITNAEVERLKHDALGREVERVRKWDESATTTTSYDSCTMCDVTVAAGECSFDDSRTVTPAMVSKTIFPLAPETGTMTMSRTAPTTRRYFDKLGRPIRTEVEAFEGAHPRRVDAFYDARGRLACESAPYHSDETPHYTKYAYDVRDRVTALTRPDGGSTAIVYGAVAAAHRVKATATQTVKEAGGMVADRRARERLHNILGELVEATDGSDQMSANRVTTTYAYDTSGLLKTVTADGVETSFEYDAAGNRESVTNPDMGRAADGKSVKFKYTGLGQVRERTDGRGTTSYRYDLLGRPTSRVDPAGTGWKRSRRRGATTRRTARGGWRAAATAARRSRRRTSTTIRRGWRRRRRLSGTARYPTSITNAAEHVEQLEHDARLGLPTKATDANNRVARLKYDALGREVERVREWDKSATTTTSYDSCTMCDVTVAAGKCSFDESRTVKPAMVSETISPMTPTMQGAMSREAPTTRRYFDKLGRPIRTEVEAFEGDNPRRVDAFYDARGRLACESAPYHSDETPHYTKYAYDVRDRVTAVTRPDGGSTAIVYGAVAAAHRVKATATQTVKEADGTVADTRASERLYNILGELVEATDGSDQMSANKVTTTYVYDTSGLLETVTADGVETSFEYDAAGNRESVTNPDMGTAADGKSVKFAYTGLGQVRERTDGRGTTSYRYDLLGRPTSRVDPAGGMKTVTATWSYDPTNGKGRLASRGYGGTAFSETYEYNDQARLEETTTTIRDGSTTETLVASYGYDSLGRPSTTTYPSELKVERGYNARGYLSTLADATTATKKTLVTYGAMDARGNIETETFGNGAQTTRAHDPKTGRATAIGTSRGTSTFQNHAYAWLTDGSLASRTANAAGGGATARTLRKEEFDYDYLGRLDSAATKLGGATTASRTLDYGYDNRGNLTSKTSDASGDDDVTSTMYEQRSAGPHALTRATVGDVVHDFHYDAQGHLERDDAASGDDRFIEWDGRGLATKVTVGEAKDAEKPAARETFLYGPGGARYRKTSEWKVVAADGMAAMKSETTYYAGGYEKTTRACEVSDGTSATESVERTRVGPVLHVKRTPCGNSSADPAEIEYRHFDHLGSSASITDAAGAELVALAHDPHGERRKPDWTRRLSESEIETLAADHGDRTSRGFTGHEHLDRTGLVHMNGRLYDPLLGRFLSPDPIVANPADGQQWNLYSYAGNSPLSYVDPSGLSFCDPAQQSWCGGVGLPSGGWGGGGYSTRTVSGWSAYVTFGVYYEIVRIWQSASVSRWDAGVEGGGSWGSTGDTFWEDVQRSVIYPIVQFFFWSFQVVEQGAANEPASSHSPHSRLVDRDSTTPPLETGQSRSGLVQEVEQKARGIVKGRVDEGFNTQDEAALFLHDMLYGLSRQYNVELGARIYHVERGGLWYITAPYTDGLPNGVTRGDVPESAYGGTAGVWHTHPSGNPPNSLDMNLIGAVGKSLYVSYLEAGEPALKENDHLTMKRFEKVKR